MRKKLMPFLLWGLMVIGITGFRGSSIVRADEESEIATPGAPIMRNVETDAGAEQS
jgi:hypothetical protein